MSSVSLPSYAPPDLGRIPSYTAEPQSHERRIAHALAYRRPSADFVKQSKLGGVSLHLSAPAGGSSLPVYGTRGPVEGTLELTKIEGLAYVAVKIEGFLKLKEVAGGGTTSTVLCNETITLWRKGIDPSPCPTQFSFSAVLPTEFSDEKGSYSLPPTYEAHLSGLPGFQANVEYAVTAIASKNKTVVLGIGATTVTSPFTYYPRTRPAQALPPPPLPTSYAPGLQETALWRAHESSLVSRVANSKGISCKLYLAKSHVFHMRQPIPFHLSFSGSAMSLASLLPFLPTQGQSPTKSCMRIQVLRQTSIDVNNDYILSGSKTEIWRVVNVGEGTFRRSNDGGDYLTLAGEIRINPDVSVGGFKAGGLWVKDCIVFTITPPDALKGPIGDLRQVIPVRLTTDPYAADGSGAYVLQASPAESQVFEFEAPTLQYYAPA
ncbi:hypothetical protein DENSPDRAFT_835329 [Dentipellis sp. KUC8613]|nr:hypothetical protein DENSPDRAFT_835329 [Dentipellis sp. KUC8613]